MQREIRNTRGRAEATIVFRRFLLIGAMAWTAFAAGSTQAAQSVTGPLSSELGYPLWYGDETGLRLALCTDPNSCFFALPDPTLPPSIPGNFPDESFYWAAEAFMIAPPNDAIGMDRAAKAILVMAREAAFANGPVVEGDQVVFSRLRFFIDGFPAMEGNTYRITHPYGSREFTPAAGDAGPGVHGEGYSATFDIGRLAGVKFSGANESFPSFLIPASMDRATLIQSPGTFLDATGLAELEVSGSPFGTNFFRIEGPEIGILYPDFLCDDASLGGVVDAFGGDVLTDCVETDLFSIQGQVATVAGVDIEQTHYRRLDDDPDPNYVHMGGSVRVWAFSAEGQNLTAEVDGGTAVAMQEGSEGHYYAELFAGTEYTVPPAQSPGQIRVTNLSDTPATTKTAMPNPLLSFSQMEPPLWHADTNQLEMVLESTDISGNILDLGLLLQTEPPAPHTGDWTTTDSRTARGLFTLPSGIPPWSVSVTTLAGVTISARVDLESELLADSDSDSIPDYRDNCREMPNSDQRATSDDGYGNLCDPDLNNDGFVNFADWVQFLIAFMQSDGDPAFNEDADFNGDGVINFGDFNLFQIFWLQPPGPGME